jgi:HlyD family secretion protein
LKKLSVIHIFIVLLSLFFFYGCEHDKPVVLSGIVEVLEVRLGFEESGEIEKIDVDVNDLLQKGDHLASLDSSQLALEYQALEFDLKHAKVNLQNLQTMPRPEELARAKDVMASKKAVFDLANDEYKRAKNLYEKKVYSEQKYQQYLAEYKRSKSEFNAAQNELSLIEAGTKVEIIEAQKMQIASLEKKLSAMKIRLKKRQILSPINGTVLTRNFEPKEYIKIGQTLLSVADLDDCWIKIYLPEPKLFDIKIGDKVDVKFDSKENLTLVGTIDEISQEASFAPRMNLRKEQRSDLYYLVKVKVENKNHRLKPGMPADVYFSN